LLHTRNSFSQEKKLLKFCCCSNLKKETFAARRYEGNFFHLSTVTTPPLPFERQNEAGEKNCSRLFEKKLKFFEKFFPGLSIGGNLIPNARAHAFRYQR